MERIKQLLNLTDPIWNDLTPDLLYPSFYPRRATRLLSPETIARRSQTTGRADYENLEFLGDAVLEQILTLFVVNRQADYTKPIQYYIKVLGRNITLYCYANLKQICGLAPVETTNWKECADILEAIVGALYWYLYVQQRLGYQAIEYLYHWFVQTFPVQETLDNLIAFGSTRCRVDGGFTGWSPWSACTEGVQARFRSCSNPAPSYGGHPCEGPTMETQNCTQ